VTRPYTYSAYSAQQASDNYYGHVLTDFKVASSAAGVCT